MTECPFGFIYGFESELSSAVGFFRSGAVGRSAALLRLPYVFLKRGKKGEGQKPHF